MNGQGNGQRTPYQVILTQRSKESIARAHQQAVQVGKGQEFLDTMRAINERLRNATEQFGDPHYRLPLLKLLVYQAALSRVVVDYAIHQERPLVFVRSVKLLS